MPVSDLPKRRGCGRAGWSAEHGRPPPYPTPPSASASAVRFSTTPARTIDSS